MHKTKIIIDDLINIGILHISNSVEIRKIKLLNSIALLGISILNTILYYFLHSQKLILPSIN